ncbi:hypothetical protein GCM10010440_09070 [Kitasatospora cinereorecta]
MHQLPGGIGAQARGQDHQGPHPGSAALLRRARHHGRRNGQHGQVRDSGQGAESRVSGFARDLLGVRIDGPHLAREAALTDLPQDGLADRARATGRADHGHRARPEQGGEACHVGRPAPLVDGFAVVLVALVQRDGHLDLALVEVAVDGQAQVGEDLVHRTVTGECVRLDRVNPALAGRVDQVLDE